MNNADKEPFWDRLLDREVGKLGVPLVIGFAWLTHATIIAAIGTVLGLLLLLPGWWPYAMAAVVWLIVCERLRNCDELLDKDDGRLRRR